MPIHGGEKEERRNTTLTFIVVIVMHFRCPKHKIWHV
jgi:hypothetical protein